MQKRIVKNGIDCAAELLDTMAGAAVGLITNPTGVDRCLRSTVDLLHARGLLHCLFSPEHGVRGEAQAGTHIETGTDALTGLPVYSLYGRSAHIPSALLDRLDAVAVDLQDIGARFYTYTSTLAYAMEDCAAAGKRLIVFDRINPIGGLRPEGSVLDRRFSSFVGRYPVATRHGLTIGEYARYINETEGIGCALTVVKVSGWGRDCFFDETDLPWVMPSPNMPTPDTCLCYIGTCLAEGTNLSEGRGTTRPFELIGAPWLDAVRIAEVINEMAMPGVILRPCYFTPTFSKYAGTACRGIQLHVTDRRVFRPFETGLRLLEEIRRTQDDFVFRPPREDGVAFADLLLGSDAWRREDFSVDSFLAQQRPALAEYAARISRFYLY